MQRGSEAEVVLDRWGHVFGVATGASACSEHEAGADALLHALTGYGIPRARDVAALMRSDEAVVVPDLFTRRRISSRLDEIVFATRPCRGEQEGVLGFAAAESGLSADDLFDHPHLSLPAFGKHREIVGAWDGAGFGFRFRGDKLTRKMSEFGASLKGGNGVFAASFLRGSGGSRLSGVVIGLVTLMRPEDRAAVGKEQSDFAATVRLEGRARTQEIAALAEKAFAGTGRSFGYVWPVWRGGVVDSEVAYCVNPGFGTTLRGGPYEFEQLATWLRGGAVGLI